jgi:hypothetical protein
VPTVSFAEGLRRLIDHAPRLFFDDIGSEIHIPLASPDTKTYALNFLITGFSQCQVIIGGEPANARCQAYQGHSAGSARQTFTGLVDQLRAFAGAGADVEVRSGKGLTNAYYEPRKDVHVQLDLLNWHNAYFVFFMVRWIPKAKPPERSLPLSYLPPA